MSKCAIVIDSNDNIGIGTTSPSYKLDVSAGTSLTSASITHSGNDGGFNSQNTGTLATGRTSQIRLVNGSTVFGANDRTYQLINKGESSNASQFDIQYWDGTSYLPRFTVKSNGNIGIGETLPAAKLHVNGTSIFTDDAKFESTIIDSDDYSLTRNDLIGFDITGNLTAIKGGNLESKRAKLIDHDQSIFNSGRYMQDWIDIDTTLDAGLVHTLEVFVVTKGGAGCDIDFSLDKWDKGTESYSTISTDLNLEEETHDKSGLISNTVNTGDRLHLVATYNSCGGLYPLGLSYVVTFRRKVD